MVRVDGWSKAEIDALAPDANSLKAAQKLVTSAKWPLLGISSRSLWGECQGSGKKPYQTRIDFSEPAFKCSCPSRKFPCKHALALFHLFAQDPSLFAEASEPAWVAEWLQARTTRAAEAQKKVEDAKNIEEPVVDPKAQVRRTAAREQRVQGGLAELSLWICDLVRTGLAQVPAMPSQSFETFAARLIDAQAPGIAQRVRALPAIVQAEEDWATHLLGHLGQLQIIATAYTRQAQLPEEIRYDLRRTVGWSDNQQELLAQEGAADSWLVLAQQHSQEAQLRVRKSWLWGKATGQTALVLEFAHGSNTFPTRLVAGQKWSGELVFFPSQQPLRAAVKSQNDVQEVLRTDLDALDVYPDFEAMLDAYAAAMARNCWQDVLPVYLRNLTITRVETAFGIRDERSCTVPLPRGFSQGWQLLALSGGMPIDLIGIWNGAELQPLAVWDEGLYLLEGML